MCTYTVTSEDFHASHMSGSVTDYRARECNSPQHDLFGAGVLQTTASRLLCKPQTHLGANEGSDNHWTDCNETWLDPDEVTSETYH